MSNIVEKGENVFVIERRRFENDIRRHFVGEVDEIAGETARVSGYIFVFDRSKNQYVRNPKRRTRLIALADSNNVINVLPLDANVELVVYRLSPEKHMTVTDGTTFSLDINEFGTLT